MIAAIYKCDAALETYFKFGGIHLTKKDASG